MAGGLEILKREPGGVGFHEHAALKIELKTKIRQRTPGIKPA
jgi:hypothetical protein